MTDQQKRQIEFCRAKGASVSTIAEMVGLPIGTVKSYCSRQKESELPVQKCQYCGSPIMQTEGRKAKHFCNQSCYFRWRYSQGDLKRTAYKKKCAHCGKTFDAVSKKEQKYCSRDCFNKSRGGDRSG